METVVQSPPEPELHLLTEWSEPGRGKRTRAAAIGSLLTHVAIVAIVASLPAYVPPAPEQNVHRTITPLIEPLSELTQRAPNTAKVTKEFNAHDLEPRPRIQLPQGAVSTTRPAAARPAPVIPPMPAPKAAQPNPQPEMPKLEAKATPPAPTINLPTAAPTPPPPPQIQPEEKKSPFENVAPAPTGLPNGRSQVPIPGSSVSDALRAQHNPQAGGLTVGDAGVGVGGIGQGVNLPPSPGARSSQIQLLSDPMGVDFRPYLTQILATVRRNWMAVMPESVRLGRRGQVAIQFSIARDGKVPKLVIATSSGADPLDRAAIAGISASSPFPPLPGEFKGERIVLQFNFSYNMPKP